METVGAVSAAITIPAVQALTCATCCSPCLKTPARKRVSAGATISTRSGPCSPGAEAREDFENAVRAETFDRDAAADALERLRASRETLELGLQDVMLDLMSELDAETRTGMLEATRERDGYGHRRPRDDRGEGPQGDRPPPPDGPRPD